MPRLYYPVKPWNVTQAWGIYNPAYLQFGFSKHNGIDVQQGTDRIVYCPIKNLDVYDTQYGDATGWRVKGNTRDVYDFPDGIRAKLNIIVMHGEKILCKTGDTLQVGDQMMISDNTGFSTGPHVHFMVRRVHPVTLELLDKNDADNSIDPAPYFTSLSAKDYGILEILKLQLLQALSFLSSRKGT